MFRAAILTTWVGTGIGTENGWHPKLEDDYSLKEWEDVTGQSQPIPDPNVYVIEVECTEVVLDAIIADLEYGEAAILWSRETV